MQPSSNYAVEQTAGLFATNQAGRGIFPADGSRTHTHLRTSLIPAEANALSASPCAAVRGGRAQVPSGGGRRVRASQSMHFVAGGGGAAAHPLDIADGGPGTDGLGDDGTRDLAAPAVCAEFHSVLPGCQKSSELQTIASETAPRQRSPCRPEGEPRGRSGTFSGRTRLFDSRRARQGLSLKPARAN